MKIIFSRKLASLSIFLMALFSLTGCERAPKIEKFEDLVPKEAVAVVTVANVGQTLEGFQKTAVAQLLERQDIKRFAAQQFPGKLPFNRLLEGDLSRVQEFFQGRGIITVLALPKQGEDIPESVLIADVKESKKAFQTFLEKELVPQLQQKYPQMQVSKEKYAKVKYQQVTFPQGHTLFYVILDKAFVLSPSLNAFKRIIDMYWSKGENPSIQENEFYQNTIKEVSQGSEGYGYLDLQKIDPETVTHLTQDLSQQQALGLQVAIQQLQTLGWGFSFENGGIHDKVYARIDPEKTEGIVEILENSANLRTLEMIPEEMVFYAGVTIHDPAGLWSVILDALQETMDPVQYEGFQQVLRYLEQQPGLDVEKIFENLAGEIAFAMGIKNFSLESLLSGVSGQGKFSLDNFPVQLLVQVKDTAKHLETIHQLFRVTESQIQQELYQNITISSFPLSNAIIPARLYYAFLDDIWIATLSKNALKAIVDLHGREAGSLQQAEKMEKLRQHLSEEVFSMTYLDIPGLLRILDRSLQGMAGILVRGILAAQGVDLAELPNLRAIANSLSGSLTVATVKEQGIMLESYSPVGNMLIETGLISGIISSFIPPDMR